MAMVKTPFATFGSLKGAKEVPMRSDAAEPAFRVAGTSMGGDDSVS
jgi:hypothetical protein